MSEVTSWENAHREQGDFDGPPPWNIGEPQPELAADGYTVHGIDMAPTAITAATTAAEIDGPGMGPARLIVDSRPPRWPSPATSCSPSMKATSPKPTSPSNWAM